MMNGMNIIVGGHIIVVNTKSSIPIVNTNCQHRPVQQLTTQQSNPNIGNTVVSNTIIGNTIVGNTIVGNTIIGNTIISNTTVDNRLTTPSIGNTSWQHHIQQHDLQQPIRQQHVSLAIATFGNTPYNLQHCLATPSAAISNTQTNDRHQTNVRSNNRSTKASPATTRIAGISNKTNTKQTTKKE